MQSTPSYPHLTRRKLKRANCRGRLLARCQRCCRRAWGSLFKALRLQKGETLLVRGGTTSIGLAAAAIAKEAGCTVLSTTRSESRAELLKKSGATHVILDSGSVVDNVLKVAPDGVDKVLELIGTTSLEDSLLCVKVGGAVCMTGMVGNKMVV